MPKPVLLNHADHKDLRVNTARGARFGDAVMTAFVVAHEFRNLQPHYPIVFYKSEDGNFQPLVLFGFEEGENLFLNADGWDAGYIPLTLQHQPFLIGRNGDEMTIHIDLDNPRVNQSEGEAIFLPYGGASDYLERINSVLAAIHDGVQGAAAFNAALLEHKLLESFAFDVELGDGSQHRLNGFYAIHEERLAALDGAALEKLQRAGHLMPIYMAVASLSQLRSLAERKVKAHAAANA